MEFKNEDYEKFNYYIEHGVDELRDTESWSDNKIAFYLRDMANSINPRKSKSKKISINPLKISDEDLEKLPEDIKKQVREYREILNSLKVNSEEAVSIPPNLKRIGYP